MTTKSPIHNGGTMDEQDALNESRRRWGASATIYDRLTRNAEDRKRNPQYYNRIDKWVGCASFKDYKGNHIYGNGDTWEAAFADAEERQKGFIR